MEASGTSGEKAEMNGVVNLSVKDGWWLEGYREGAGWALTEKRTYQNQEYQDRLDAATIYSLLENEIMPLYYDRNEKGCSEGWIRVIKNSIAQIAPHYTMKRQLDDYYAKFYNKLRDRSNMLRADNYRQAREIALWKEVVAERWDAVNVVSIYKDEDVTNGNIEAGRKYNIEVVIDEAGLDNAIGVELVTLVTDKEGQDHIYQVAPFELKGREGNKYIFSASHSIDNAGSFKICYRLYPKNDLLPHRQDFCYVKWFA